MTLWLHSQQNANDIMYLMMQTPYTKYIILYKAEFGIKIVVIEDYNGA